MPPNPRRRHPPFAVRDGLSMAGTQEATSGTKVSAVRRDPTSRPVASAARKDSRLAVSVKVVAIKAVVTACAGVGHRSRDEVLLVIATSLKVVPAWDGQDAAQMDLVPNGRDVRTSAGAAVLKAAPALAHHRALAVSVVSVRKALATWPSSTATNGAANRDKAALALVAHHRARAANAVSARKALATWPSSIVTIDVLDRVRAVLVDSASSVTSVRSNTRSEAAQASIARKARKVAPA